MNPEAQKLLDKAARSIDAAETLVQQGHLDFATAKVVEKDDGDDDPDDGDGE